MKKVGLSGIAVLILAAHANGQTRVLNRRLQHDETVAHALYSVGVATGQVDQIIGALSGVFDFRKAKEGDQLRMVVSHGELDFLDYRQGPLDEWQARRNGEEWVGTRREIEVQKKVAWVELSVESSLYEAAQKAGEDPSLAMGLSDVFAWDIDFYQDVRKGDTVRAMVEKYTSKGKLVRYGEIIAAEYHGELVGQKRVFRYQLPTGDTSYFQEDGKSARKSFLKSPLKYARVTSGYGNRFHPILKYIKAHNGVDYGTPVGTPVWAVADGTVIQAARGGAAGNHVCVRHNNGFETCYLHLSRFGAGIHVGARVGQKQIVGYSGNTGRSTGPHLHFALKRGGHFVNPLKQSFPRSEPLPTTQLADFLQHIGPFLQQLNASSVAAAVSVTR